MTREENPAQHTQEPVSLTSVCDDVFLRLSCTLVPNVDPTENNSLLFKQKSNCGLQVSEGQ